MGSLSSTARVHRLNVLVSVAKRRKLLCHLRGRRHGGDLARELHGGRFHVPVGQGFDDVLGQDVMVHSRKERSRRTRRRQQFGVLKLVGSLGHDDLGKAGRHCRQRRS